MLEQSSKSLLLRVLSVVCLAWAVEGAAHTLPISFLTLVPDENYLHLELTLNPFELTFFSELDVNRNGRLDSAECSSQSEKIASRIINAITLRVGGKVVPPETAGLSESSETDHITVRVHYPVDARKAEVLVESRLTGITTAAHFTQVLLNNGDQTQAARLDAQFDQARFDPTAQPIGRLGRPQSLPNKQPPCGSMTQRAPAIALLAFVVSVLLLTIGSAALLIRRSFALSSKAHFSELHPTTPFEKLP